MAEGTDHEVHERDVAISASPLAEKGRVIESHLTDVARRSAEHLFDLFEAIRGFLVRE